MLEWMVYGLGRRVGRKPINGGTSYTRKGAGDQARRGLQRSLEAGFVGPNDQIEFAINGETEYEGTAEGFLGRTALKEMGL